MSRCLGNALLVFFAGQALAAPDLVLSEIPVIDLSDDACIRRAVLRIDNHGDDAAWGATVFAGTSETPVSVLTQITAPIRPGGNLLLVVCRPPRLNRRFCIDVKLLRLADSDRNEDQRRDNRLCWSSSQSPQLPPTVQINQGEHP